MQTVTTIGFDIAKSVFQVHGVDAVGQVVVGRQLKRGQVIAFFQELPRCLVGIEAWASSHDWSRELQASKLPTGKSIEIMAVGSRTDWSIADQSAQYLKAKGFDVSFSRTSETVPPLDRKITIRDNPAPSPIIVIIARSAL